jgi:hypothetical protein
MSSRSLRRRSSELRRSRELRRSSRHRQRKIRFARFVSIWWQIGQCHVEAVAAGSIRTAEASVQDAMLTCACLAETYINVRRCAWIDQVLEVG